MSKYIDKDYVAHILTIFEKIFDEVPHDVILVAGIDKQEVSAHCLIMKAASKYFDALLERNYVEGAQNKVVVNGIDGETLRAIVDYCHSGRIEVCGHNAGRVIAAATHMRLLDIGKSVSRCWGAELSEENCLEILEKTHTYSKSMQEIWQKAVMFCAMEFQQLPSPKKLDLDGEVLLKLLECEKFKITEEDIFTFVVAWVEQNEKDRAKFVPDILPLIRLKHITSESLHGSVEPFFRKYGCSDLVKKEYQIRANNDGDAEPKLNRFTVSEIFSVNWNSFDGENDRKFCIKTYNFNSNQWEHFQTIPLSVPYEAARAVISNGKLFTVYYSEPNVHVVLCDLDTFRESHYQHKSEYRQYFAPVLVGKYIYVIGGTGVDDSGLSLCERFDTKKNRWERRKSMPTVTAIRSAVEFKGKIFASVSWSIYCYDIESDEWTTDVSDVKEHCGAIMNLFRTGQLLYAVTVLNILHRYDPIENTWNMIVYPNKKRGLISAIGLRGTTYALYKKGRFGTANLDRNGSFSLLNVSAPFVNSLLYVK